MGKLNTCLIFDNQISITIIKSTDIVQKANNLLKLSPVACAALGRLLTFAAIRSGTLKNANDYFSVSINGGGEIGTLTACGNGKLTVKGTVGNPNVESFFNSSNKLDVKKAVGDTGKLTFIANYGGKEPYIGTSKLVSGEIAEDIAFYYAVSEQKPCAISLGVTVDKDGKCLSAGGVFVQILPNCSEEAVQKIEKLLPDMQNISGKLFEKDNLALLEQWFGKEFEVVKEQEIAYKCDCGKKRMEKVLITLGKAELEDIIIQHGNVEAVCHFCNKKYVFEKEDLSKLFR